MNGQEKSQSLSSIPRRLGMAQEKPQGGGALRLPYPRQDRNKSYGSEIGLHTPKGRCAFNCSGREMLLVTEAKVFSHGAPMSLGETLSSPRGGGGNTNQRERPCKRCQSESKILKFQNCKNTDSVFRRTTVNFFRSILDRLSHLVTFF